MGGGAGGLQVSGTVESVGAGSADWGSEEVGAMRKSETGKGVLAGFHAWITSALSFGRDVDGQDTTWKPSQDRSS